MAIDRIIAAFFIIHFPTQNTGLGQHDSRLAEGVIFLPFTSKNILSTKGATDRPMAFLLVVFLPVADLPPGFRQALGRLVVFLPAFAWLVR